MPRAANVKRALIASNRRRHCEEPHRGDEAIHQGEGLHGGTDGFVATLLAMTDQADRGPLPRGGSDPARGAAALAPEGPKQSLGSGAAA
jgi:hypothetical protein